MPLRIAFDLDGVLADMEGELVRQAVTLFGAAVAAARRAGEAGEAGAPAAEAAGGSGDTTGSVAADVASDDVPPLLQLNLTSHQQSRLWRHVATLDNFWETLEECEPGVVLRLASVAADRRWEVIFLTKRPESRGATAQVQTQRWLASKGFALPSVFVVQGSRGRIAASLGLDIVVDDRPENCLDVVTDSTARPILVWRTDPPPPQAARLGIGVVATVNQCLDILTELDKTPDRRPGVVDRVMRLLGLKVTTSA